MEEVQQSERIQFRLPPDRRHLIEAAAARRGLGLSAWMRRVTEDALRREFGPTALGTDAEASGAGGH